MREDHPLERALADRLPRLDFAVLSHGFAFHGRDYIFMLQAAGTFELLLTHVVELQYETRVRDDVWPSSWDDTFTDYARWEAAGEPDGYVWGSNWSLAYPGLTLLKEDPGAASWSIRLGKALHAATLETDRFWMRVVFHEARTRKVSEDTSLLEQATSPLA